MGAPIQIDIFTGAGLLAFAWAAKEIVGRDWAWLLRPEPNYGDAGGHTLLHLDSTKISESLFTFFNDDTERTRTATPYPLGRFWWAIWGTNLDKRSATVQLDYVEDINRYVESRSLSDRVNLQKFQLLLHLEWTDFGIGANGPQTGINYSWTVKNKYRFKSASARPMVEYTMQRLRERFSTVPGTRVRTGGPLAGTFGGSGRRPRNVMEHKLTNVPTHLTNAKVSWPTPQEFNEAIQTPAIAFRSEPLRSAQLELTEIGLPRPITGAFASVYRMENGTHAYAVKCFLRGVKDQAERYSKVTSCLHSANLRYTVGFEFIPEGIRLGSNWYPILQMDWVEGATIPEFLEEHGNDQQAVLELATEFLRMCHQLKAAGIAHGDLQHGNILITSEGLRLVDYDGMFVPGMEGLPSNELGHRNYQHPHRDEHLFGPNTDNFSAWIIYLSLKCIAADPVQWQTEHAGDECLLLRQADYLAPETSAAFERLRNSNLSEVRKAADFLSALCQMPPHLVPPIEADISDDLLFRIRQVQHDSERPASAVPAGVADSNDTSSNLPDWMN